MRHRERQDRRGAWSPGAAACVLLVLAAGAAAAQTQDADDPLSAGETSYVYDQQSLRVDIWVDKPQDQVYKRGETVQVGFQANEDAYAVVYHVDVEGYVRILWPTSRFSDGFVFGVHEYRLPAQGGQRLRAASEEGVAYIQVIASRYPFDLRDLPIDFHHESANQGHEFYVAGDPYLAMNEVNHAVTGLEDPSEWVVTNHVSYYVHREVDHPRYLCTQCHFEDDLAHHPYRDSCTITIRHDYGWVNSWYVRYGYYPAYYYPVYHYLDPWSWTPWVHYWYPPAYFWPSVVVYQWNYNCYDWRHSPYYPGDSTTIRKHGSRQYRPLDKGRGGGERIAGATTAGSRLVTQDRPGESRLGAMRERTVRDADAAGRRDRSGPAGGVASRNVDPVSRSRTKFTPQEREWTSPGLRVPGRGGTATVRTSDRGPRPAGEELAGSRGLRGPDSRLGGQRRSISPVTPRDGSSRTWTGRRTSEQVKPNTPARTGGREATRDRGRISDQPTKPRRTDGADRGGRGSQPRVERKQESSGQKQPARKSGSGSSGSGSRGGGSGGRGGGSRTGGRG